MTKLKVNIFENDQTREKALADFNDLLKHPGWLLVKSICYSNMDYLKNIILDGSGDDEDLQTIKELRNKLKAYRDVVTTPETMIEKLRPDDPEIHEENDPYPVVKIDKDKKL